jgi:hypothetical protein
MPNPHIINTVDNSLFLVSHYPSFASGSQEISDFLGVALQVQQHEVCFSRVAALQCAVLFAPLRFAQEDLNYDFSSEFRSFKQTNIIKS